MFRLKSIGFIIGLLLFMGCNDEIAVPDPVEKGATLLFAPLRSINATDDPDNLDTEYAILNLSIFLTDAFSNTITDKYVHTSFTSITDTSIMNCKSVNLPLDPATVPLKDVYVIANCDDTADLNAAQTVDDLKALKTPPLVVPNILTTERGLPMYGNLTGVDFSNTGNTPMVMLTRACAKIRVTLLFPDPTWIGTNNKFAIENAASYAFFIKNPPFTITPSELLDYSMIQFIQNTPQEFVNVTYIYESTLLPRLHLYTTVNNTAKEYMADSNFPLPVRNHLYDIEIQILHPMNPSNVSRVRSQEDYDCKTTVRISEW